MKINSMSEALLYGRNFLKQENVDSYIIDSKVLLMNVCGITAVEIYVKDEITEQEFSKYKDMLQQRASKRPVAYIINNVEFMSLDFYVDSSVLIPRPDTEILVETSIEYISQNKYKSVLDIGTGSGAIAISIGKYTQIPELTAVDISDKALTVAKKNATFHNVKVDFIQSDLFECVERKFDIIVSNPPYISTSIIGSLGENVKNYEPLIALDGGEDGLDFYRSLVENAKLYLNCDGMILFEIGHDQGVQVYNLLETYGFCNITIKKDLAGLDRVVYGTLPQ